MLFLVAEKCGNVTMDDHEAINEDVVTCCEDTLADEVEGGTGDDTEEQIDNDDHHC